MDKKLIIDVVVYQQLNEKAVFNEPFSWIVCFIKIFEGHTLNFIEELQNDRIVVLMKHQMFDLAKHPLLSKSRHQILGCVNYNSINILSYTNE